MAPVLAEPPQDLTNPRGRAGSAVGPTARVLLGLSVLACLVVLGWMSLVAARTTLMPEVVGHASADAARDVRRAGLRYDSITIPGSAPRDTIVRTDPTEGTVLPKGSQVVLWVSSGRTDG